MKFVAILALAVLFPIAAHAVQPLSALCSGPGAHDFKTHFSDVRNQDDSVRDSGDATFDLCANINNTGRDAPRHLRSGPVYDEYEVSGIPVYTSGHKDPLLYVQCVVDLFTDAADGTSLKDVRHVCTHHNGWMNVAAGSTGNAGNIGPAGFGPSTGGGAAGDPQVISYQPQMLDGSTNILDWTNLNATINSSANPINPTGCNTPSGQYQGPLSMNVPASTGNNIWFEGMAVRVSTTGTAVGGLTSSKLYWVYNCGSVGTGGTDTQDVQLLNIPTVYQQLGTILTTSQGSGTTSFTQVFWHPHWSSWQDEDISADQSWATRGSAARFTRRIYPAFTLAEKQYWEQTGLIEAVNLSQTPSVPIPWSHEATLLYAPFSKGNVIGTQGTGERPDLGFATEWHNQAFVSGTQTNWFLSRLYSMGSQTNGWSVLIDEATGRIPVLTNGPPTGPGGTGAGGSYGSGSNSSIPLGTPQNQTSMNAGFFHGVVNPNQNIPNGTVDWRCTWAACGTFVSHVPNFVSYSYWFFGERLFLDSLYFAAERDLFQLQPGPGSGEGGAIRDNILTIPAGTFHYWGNGIACCQGRGSAWSLRDRTLAASSGGDGNIERSYFNDQITENLNYYAAWLQYKQGLSAGQLTGTTVTTSQLPPDYPGSWQIPDTYVASYIAKASWGMTTHLHAPDPAQWVTPFQRYYEQQCGLSTNPPPFYCIDFTLSIAIANGDNILTTGGIGPDINGVDSSNNGNQQNGTNLTTGGVWQYASPGFYTFTNGDTVQLINGAYYGGLLIDQLPGNRKFPIMNVNNSNSTFQIQCNSSDHTAFPTQCPTAGGPFTGYTRSGNPIAPETQDLLVYRLQFNPGPNTGYADNNYSKYGGTVMNLLKVMNYDAPDARAQFQTQGGNALYNPAFPGWFWDPTIVVPGINFVPLLSFSPIYPALPCSATPGTAVAAVTVTGGNGNPIRLSMSDPSSSFVLSSLTPPANVIIGSSGINPSICTNPGLDIINVTAAQ